MIARLILALLILVMIAGAIYYQPTETAQKPLNSGSSGTTLKLMTWNIGYAELEDDTRAHTRDLPDVAKVILDNDPDAVALQELTGQAQLNLLLEQLKGGYKGAVSPAGKADRVDCVLVKSVAANFEPLRAGDSYAVAGRFTARPGGPEVMLVSAHADAFSATHRRIFTGDVVDNARNRARGAFTFVAGDFNFEVSSRDQSNLYTDNLKNDSESYSYLLKYFKDMARTAGDTAINDRRIDYIFGPLEKTDVQKAEVLRNAAVGRMDHWPVVVEVKLRER
jgi:endonuclease/exonuclease/phosphatase family metal-dependent hydrolase